MLKGINSPFTYYHLGSAANLTAVHLITTRKAENAVQVTKSLKTITNQSLSPTTVQQHPKKANMKAVVKRKCPLLSAKHHKAHLDYAHAHKDWTMKD